MCAIYMPQDYVSFPQTAWSLVRKAQDSDGDEYVTAMNRCIVGYWKPVFSFLLAKGREFHEAEDLTQEFFQMFFERNWILPANPERGRFRTFLLTILTRFVADQGPGRATRQRVFDERLISVSTLIGDDEHEVTRCLNETPDAVFMRQWARAIITGVQRALELWCEGRGRPDWYRMFSAVHFPSSTSERITQQFLAERYHVSRDQIRYALQETESRFAALLRAEVAEQVESADDLAAEIQELQALLSDQ